MTRERDVKTSEKIRVGGGLLIERIQDGLPIGERMAELIEDGISVMSAFSKAREEYEISKLGKPRQNRKDN